MGDFILTIGVALRWLGFAATPLLLLPFLLLIAPKRFARPARGVREGLDAISTLTLHGAMVLAVFMVLVQILVIIGRYMFDWSASWANDLIIYSFAAMFLIAAGSALKHDAHVRVDILREGMSARRRAGIDLAGIYLFLFPICFLIVWSSISPSFVRSWAQFEGARESDGLPLTYLFKTLVPLFGVMLILQGLSQAVQAAGILRGLPEATGTAPHAGIKERPDGN